MKHADDLNGAFDAIATNRRVIRIITDLAIMKRRERKEDERGRKEEKGEFFER